MERDVVYAEVVELLRGMSPKAKSAALDASVDFLKSGLLDSFALLELVGKVEQKFDVSIDISAVDFDTFTTLGGFCDAIVAQKK